MELTRMDDARRRDGEEMEEEDKSGRDWDTENHQEHTLSAPPQRHSAILMVVCISIVVVSPMLLMVERGPETAASSLLLVAVSLIQINSAIVGGAASRAVGMVLASLAVAMFICSLLEELKPEESARNIIVDRGKCVNSSKDWSSRIGNICDDIFRKDGFFYLDENVTQEDTEWPLKVFKISKGVRERIPQNGLKNLQT